MLNHEKMIIFVVLSILISYCYNQGYCPERIISLGPSITKSLYSLGVEEKLIANTIYCDTPPQAREKEKIGTVLDINIEKIFSLKPDLVLATSLTHPKSIEKLKKLGIRVVTFPTPNNFSDLCEQFIDLGRILGKEETAKEIVKKAKEKVESIKSKYKKTDKPKVIVQVGANPLFVATGDYFINDYIELAGGINIAKRLKRGLYSREKILEENPDVIIITPMGFAGEKEKEIWMKYKTLNAVKFNRIYIYHSDELTSPTPTSFAETLEDIICILHGERNR